MITSCQEKEQGQKYGPDGFISLLTNENITNWSGDSTYWKFENNVLTGEITPDKILTQNNFFIWKGTLDSDFELKVEYKISDRGNSGVNYLSKEPKEEKYLLKGYQADIDGSGKYSGQLYDEGGRKIIARPGQVVHVDSDNQKNVITNLNTAEQIEKDEDGWNQYHIIYQNNTIIHMINGDVKSIVFDQGNQEAKGSKLGLQLHLGPPMKVQFKNLRLKIY